MDYQFKIGHTAITWPEEELEQAVADVASLGYRAFECFGWTLEAWEKERPGAYKAVLEKHGMRQYSSYMMADFAVPEKRESETENVITWGKILKSLGGEVAVLGGRRRKKETYSLDEYKAMAQTVNDIATRLRDIGITCCFHQHTRTPVETQDEVYTFMNEIDPEVVLFGPDVGQILKGGGDPVKVVRDFKAIIKHVHLKDFVGGTVEYNEEGKEVDTTGYLSYLPLGEGVVPIPEILEILAEMKYDGFVMAELDGTKTSPRPPKEAAAISKRYLQSLGQKF